MGARKVADISSEDVDRLLGKIARGLSQKKAGFRRVYPSPIAANRAGAAIRKMFSLAIWWKMRPDNPTQGFVKNPETPRGRYLDHDEIDRLSAGRLVLLALDARPIGWRYADAFGKVVQANAALGPLCPDWGALQRVRRCA